MCRRTAHRGFTLIELLVVIAIIGLLAAVVLASLNTARAKARDTRRMSDLKEVQKALEMYYHDHGSYPNTSSAWRGNSPDCYGAYISTGGSDASIPGLAPTYIPSIPQDPKPRSGACYLYRSDGANYMFLAHGTVESFDPDTGPHPMDRAAYNQQSIAVFTSGAASW